jgi:hypothetical protein
MDVKDVLNPIGSAVVGYSGSEVGSLRNSPAFPENLVCSGRFLAPTVHFGTKE